MEADEKMMWIAILLGISAGLLSYILDANLPNTISYPLILFTMIMMLILTGHIPEKILKITKEEIKSRGGWFSNGVIPFYFTWLLTWVVIYNII